MQDRYTGDVGDFGKYGLLRHLSGLRNTDTEPQLQLGVVWYRPDPATVESELSNDDGKFIAYLRPDQKPRFHPCDPTLYKVLREIVRSDDVQQGDRRVEAVEDSGVLGDNTQFHGVYVPGPATQARGETRADPRRAWTEEALRATEGCEIVFLDPDNGLEPPSVAIRHKAAIKYAYLEEVKQWFARGQSVVIYHHLGRSGGTHEAQIADWRNRLQERLNPADIFAVRFHRSNSRAFFVLAAETHKDILRRRADALLQSPWGEGKDPHFTGPF